MTELLCPACGQGYSKFDSRCPACQKALPTPPLDDLTLSQGAGSQGTPPAPREDPLLGQLISHFRIQRVLGQGGMGVVYQALDLELGRVVALKFLANTSHTLRDEARFRREAQATAALDHPNIGTIYEVGERDGQRFIAMAYYDGETLAARLAREPEGRLATATTAFFAGQLASALAAAHAASVVHRDLKPENVMITRDGRVKLLDFGLAKWAGASTVTEQGVVVGTAAYMAPEQLRGKESGTAGDLWAFGVVLYQMLAGERPFGRERKGMMHAILFEDPPALRDLRPDVPEALERIVARCLAKEPRERYPDASAILAELTAAGLWDSASSGAAGRHTDAPGLERLRSKSGEAVAPAAKWLGAVRSRAGITVAVVFALALAVWLGFESSRRPPGNEPGKLPRLAVLPFEDLGAPEDAYFAAGMTEEIISGLATVHGLEVISRRTVTQYSRAGKQLREIGRDLGVDYVLEGTVRWDRSRPGRDRMRITPQLIRVSDDTYLWGDQYDRDLADVFAVQSDIARQVVRALGITLSARERRLVEVPPTRNPEAYQLYLRGLQMLNTRIANSLGNNLLGGADLMHRAAELDPEFAQAHAREASALAYTYFLGGPAENRERARAALARAQALAPDDPRVRVSAGFVYYHGARDYRRALLEFEAAGRAMPSYEGVPYAIGSVLRRLGRYEEALDYFARASEMGTSEGVASWFIDRDSAVTNWALRRYPEADRLYEHCLRVAPDEWALWSERTVLQLHWKGDTAAARAALADAPLALEAELIETRVLIELWDRRFAAAVALAQPRLDPRLHRKLEWYVAYADLRLGRTKEASDISRRLIAAREERLIANPNSAFLHEDLALAYALLGEREPALAHARKAVTLLANDALWGPKAVETLALVHTLLGDREQALALLPGLLEKAYEEPLDTSRLRLEPWWDPLRGDPRFERLLARGR